MAVAGAVGLLPQRSLAALPVRLAAAPYFYCVDRLGRGSVVTVVARADGTGGLTSSLKGAKR